jgi:hypothetical protein
MHEEILNNKIEALRSELNRHIKLNKNAKVRDYAEKRSIRVFPDSSVYSFGIEYVEFLEKHFPLDSLIRGDSPDWSDSPDLIMAKSHPNSK